MWHAWERRRKCAGFWWESMKERWEDVIRMDLREIGWWCRVDPVGSG
jgi:hypothetical protein